MGKDKEASHWARKGGRARISKLSPAQHARLTKKMSKARWSKVSEAKRKEIMAKVRAARKVTNYKK